MPASPRSRDALKALAAYAVMLGLCLGALTWTLQLYGADLRVPFVYEGDAGDSQAARLLL